MYKLSKKKYTGQKPGRRWPDCLISFSKHCPIVFRWICWLYLSSHLIFSSFWESIDSILFQSTCWRLEQWSSTRPLPKPNSPPGEPNLRHGPNRLSYCAWHCATVSNRLIITWLAYVSGNIKNHFMMRHVNTRTLRSVLWWNWNNCRAGTSVVCPYTLFLTACTASVSTSCISVSCTSFFFSAPNRTISMYVQSWPKSLSILEKWPFPMDSAAGSQNPTQMVDYSLSRISRLLSE